MLDGTSTAAWTPRGPWAGILNAGRFGAPGGSGVTAAARDGLGIASVAAGGDPAALVQAVKARFGFEPPSTPRIVRSRSHGLVWTGPGQWLLLAEDRRSLAGDLALLSGLAAVADQSDGRAVLRLSGPMIMATLTKGCLIDLHPRVFPPGAAAATSIAHIGVQLWRIDDDASGAVFELAVARSMAGSFWSWFSASAAEFGCSVAIAER